MLPHQHFSPSRHLLQFYSRPWPWWVLGCNEDLYQCWAVSVMLRELSSFNISAAQVACYDNEHCRGQVCVRPHHKVTGGFFTLFYVISPLLSSSQVSWQLTSQRYHIYSPALCWAGGGGGGGGGTRLTIRRLPKHNWNTSHCQTELSLSEKFQTTTSTLDKKDPDYWNCSMIDRSVVFAGLLSDSIIKRVKLFLMKLITTCCIFCLLQQTFIIIFCESVPSLLCIKTKYLPVMPIPAGQISNNKFLQARLLWCCMGEFSFFIQ